MNPRYFKDLTSLEIRDFFNDIDFIIFDCDGVLWLSEQLIQNTTRVVNGLHQKGKAIFYYSNNSTMTVERFITKFILFGFIFEMDHVYLTAPLVGLYLKDHIDSSQCVYVVGPEAVHIELRKHGIQSFGNNPASNPITGSLLDLPSNVLQDYIPLKENVGAVVIAYDEYFNYMRCLKACTYLLNPECLFIATNSDTKCPHSNTDYCVPDTGTFITSIEFASNRKATVLGKPELYTLERLLKDHNINPKRTLMVGDRYDTDILFGNRAGFRTLMVLTGIHKLSDIVQIQKSENETDRMSIPMYYTDSVADLLPAVEAIQQKT